MEYRIRKAVASDVKKAALVEAEAFPPQEAASLASLTERQKTFPDSFFVAVTEEGEVVGLINGSMTDEKTIRDEMFEDSSLHNPQGAYQAVFGLAVDVSCRHMGVASQLMRRLIEEAEKAGKKGLTLTCKESLIPFYEKFGYKNMGVSASVHGGAQWYDMILEFENCR